jgi:hypothetical protein
VDWGGRQRDGRRLLLWRSRVSPHRTEAACHQHQHEQQQARSRSTAARAAAVHTHPVTSGANITKRQGSAICMMYGVPSRFRIWDSGRGLVV